ncbi:MAG: efflux transporter outer membrane subunit [Proteobacteria bacterium]|nr:efflux transporter outer membrane subunit [Pseudomonadota bacterium]
MHIFRASARLRRWPRAALVAIAALTLAACTTAPYRPPEVPMPKAFKEAPAVAANWFPAAPADALDRGSWWKLFDDPALDALMDEVAISNQNVAAAAAAYAEAQALVRAQRAALFPSLALDANAGQSGAVRGATKPASYQLGVAASWEPDLWGRLALGVAGAEASAAASAADLAAARLSAQAALATDYFTLREDDHQIALLASAVAGYQRSLAITVNQYNAGIAQRTDVLEAKTQLATTQANLVALEGQRAVLEHAIALLVGKPPGEFGIAVAGRNTTVPAVPLVVPSELLQRRPDIAAAERAVAAANATVGIDRSAYFPGVSLSASYAGASSTLGSVVSASNSVWALGLAVAQTLFDAGAIKARVEGAEAARAVAVANYRQTVLAAFQAVEDQLATIRSLARQVDLRQEASADADRTEELTLNQYLQGQVPYTSVVTAQVTALSARQTLSQLTASRQAAAIALIEALGGGWHAPANAPAS